MKGKTIIVLGAGENQLPVIRECNEQNINTIVVDYNKDAPGFRYAKVKMHISTLDETKILEYAKNFSIDGILTTSDNPVKIVASISQKMGFNGLSIEAAAVSLKTK